MTILAFLIAIFILVGFHEFGHFIVARICGIAVERFSIGFGPVLWRSHPKKEGQTEFVLSSIPLGGYVKMIDSRTHENLTPYQQEHAFDLQPLWKRSLVVLAGPVANFVLALFLFVFLYTQGPIQVKPILAEPQAQSIAALAGVVEGDEVRGFAILNDNSSEVEQVLEFSEIQSWNRLRWKLLDAMYSGKGFALQIDHHSQGLYRVIFPKEKLSQLNMKGDFFSQLGLKMTQQSPTPTFYMENTIFQSFYLAADRVRDITRVSFFSILSLLSGHSSFSQITGPIGIASLAGQSAQSGLTSYLGFLALVSISLGLMNLLPLPMLDGGQLVFDFFEFIRGQAVSLEFREKASKIGILCILLVSGIAIFNDLTRLFHG